MQPSDDRSAGGNEGPDRPAGGGADWPTPLSRRRAEPLELLSIFGEPLTDVSDSAASFPPATPTLRT